MMGDGIDHYVDAEVDKAAQFLDGRHIGGGNTAQTCHELFALFSMTAL